MLAGLDLFFADHAQPLTTADEEPLRGTSVVRTCGTHKNLYNSLLLLTIFGPIYYAPPVRDDPYDLDHDLSLDDLSGRGVAVGDGRS